ncbi:MAG: hypothetical protein HY063_15395 [Bacteroidetes bacterium]|nr:hypothetical protein [Bacteroidota bacterium]
MFGTKEIPRFARNDTVLRKSYYYMFIPAFGALRLCFVHWLRHSAGQQNYSKNAVLLTGRHLSAWLSHSSIRLSHSAVWKNHSSTRLSHSAIRKNYSAMWLNFQAAGLPGSLLF